MSREGEIPRRRGDVPNPGLVLAQRMLAHVGAAEVPLGPAARRHLRPRPLGSPNAGLPVQRVASGQIAQAGG